MKKFLLNSLITLLLVSLLLPVTSFADSPSSNTNRFEEKTLDTLFYNNDRTWIKEGKIEVNDLTFESGKLKNGELKIHTEELEGTITFDKISLKKDYGSGFYNGYALFNDGEQTHDAEISISKNLKIVSGVINDKDDPQNNKFFTSNKNFNSVKALKQDLDNIPNG
ncbi:hypothetical protein RZN25_17095 [Bacillaceae bacterium S4-13-56]